MSNLFTVKFWGVRGSYPTPGRTALRYGGNTPCVEVRAGEQRIILDAGTGIIGLGNELMRHSRESGSRIEATLLFSHLHHDHTQGFPFFAPIHHPASRLRLFGPRIGEQSVADTLSQIMRPPAFPLSLNDLSASLSFHELHESEVVLLGDSVGGAAMRKASESSNADDLVYVRALRSYAHPNTAFIYRIEWHGHSMVYATDTEGYTHGDQRLVSFARGADLLIHDAQYSEEDYAGLTTGLPTQGRGHSTAAMAGEVARAAGVGQLVLFHHDPNYDDQQIACIEREAQRRFARTLSAYEGLTLTPSTQERLDESVKPIPLTAPERKAA